MSDTPIQLPGGNVVEGSHPVVFIGPNGSGKTTLGNTVAQASGGDRIPALRSLMLGESLPPKAHDAATKAVDQKTKQYIREIWRQADEMTDLMTELRAEEDVVNARFKTAWREDPSNARPAQTQFDRLRTIWEEVFPGRTLRIEDYKPKVRSSHQGSTTNYHAQSMSDGERAGLYLAARVLRSKKKLIVVDEPELHLHGLLARRFWDSVERAMPHARFLYITHDLPFALSRIDAEIGIVKGNDTVMMVSQDEELPDDIVEDLLGAASLSLVAKRMVFCEGRSGGSLDHQLYDAWFNGPDTAVVPVGKCKNVQEAVRVFQSKTISNAVPIGIIERDYWPEKYLTALSGKTELCVLPVNEIEGLLCLPNVVEAVAKYKKVPEGNIQTKFADFEQRVRDHYDEVSLNAVLLERCKLQVKGEIQGAMSAVTVPESYADLKVNVTSEYTASVTQTRIDDLLDKDKELMDSALEAGAANFLMYLPGKVCLNLLITTFGWSQSEYVDLVCTVLRSEEEVDQEVRSALEAALSPHLPSRSA